MDPDVVSSEQALQVHIALMTEMDQTGQTRSQVFLRMSDIIERDLTRRVGHGSRLHYSGIYQVNGQ